MRASDSPAMRFEALRVPGTERAPGHVRRRLRDLLGPEHPALADAESCVTEVVGNAVRHTDSAQVLVEIGFTARSVRVEVVDGGRAATVPRILPAGMEEGGRGLWIVAGLASEWGAERRGDGHAVRFTIRS